MAVVRQAAKEGTKLDVEVARKMLDGLRSRFTGVNKYHQAADQKARQCRQRNMILDIPLPWGHKRQLFPNMQTPSRITNTKVQGTAAIGLKNAFFEIEKAGLLDYVGATVHDEIVAPFVPENEAIEYAQALKEAMIRGMEEVCPSVPVLVETKIGPHWQK